MRYNSDMKMNVTSVVSVVLALAAGVASAYEYREVKDIPYSDASPRCVLDVKTPVGVTNFATIVNLHGGGLAAGNKCYAPWPAERQGRDPLAFVAVRYRLFNKNVEKNETRPEHCLDDAAASVAWTLRHIAEYGGDPKKVFVTGQSAGGYQSAMIGMDPKWLGKYGFVRRDLCGVAPFTGQVTKHFNVRAIGFRDTLPRYAPVVDEWAPLYWCREKDFPPICLMTGHRLDNEMPCRVEENEFLAISLKRCGVTNAEFHETEGSHGGGVPPSRYFFRDFVAKTCDAGIVGRFADGERVAFVGDSITHGGGFVADLQLYQNLRYPGSGARIMNVGISGDTARGGNARFESDILAHRPDRAFVMFGMNDVGRNFWATTEPDEKTAAARADRISGYAAQQRALVEKFAAAKVKTVLVTPSPYDQYTPRAAANLLACNEPGLATCAKIVRDLATEKHLGLVDFHAPLTALQKAHTNVVFCNDRVHPNLLGHLIMATEVLEAMGTPSYVACTRIDAAKVAFVPVGNPASGKSSNVRVTALAKVPGGLAFTYAPKALPFPLTAESREIEKFRPFAARFNNELLAVTGLEEGTYDLAFDGEKVGAFSAAELKKGVNLALLETPNQKRAQAAGALADELRDLARRRRNEQLIVNKLVAEKVDLSDKAKVDAHLDAWLTKVAKSPHVNAFRSWVKTYREVSATHDACIAREEDLRERLNAVRPAVSRVTLVRR